MKNLLKIIFINFFLLTIFACSEKSGGYQSDSAGKGGSMARFALAGNYLYAVTDYNLKIVDIKNVKDPVYKKTVQLSNQIETLWGNSENLFIGTTTGVLVYDIADPLNPVKLSEVSHITSCDPVVVQGDTAFYTTNSSNSWCSTGQNMLTVLDISDLINPKTITEINLTSPRGLGVDGDLLFVCDDGLKVFDKSDINNIKLISYFEEILAYDVIPDNDVLILTGEGGIYQYSYKDKNIELLSSILIKTE